VHFSFFRGISSKTPTPDLHRPQTTAGGQRSGMTTLTSEAMMHLELPAVRDLITQASALDVTGARIISDAWRHAVTSPEINAARNAAFEEANWCEETELSVPGRLSGEDIRTIGVRTLMLTWSECPDITSVAWALGEALLAERVRTRVPQNVSDLLRCIWDAGVN